MANKSTTIPVFGSQIFNETFGNNSPPTTESYQTDNLQGLELAFNTCVPFLCAIGLVGNSMGVILIQTNAQLKRFQSNQYLSASAISSCVFLFNLFLSWALPFIPDWNSQLTNPAYCKIVTFLAHWTDMACVWLIVAVSVDRMIILLAPSIRPRFRTPKSTHVITFLIIFLSLCVSSWTLFLVYPINRASRYYCLVKDALQNLYNLFNAMETVVGVVLPSAVIFLMNCIIVCKIRSYSRSNNIQLPGESTATPDTRRSKSTGTGIALTPLLDKNLTAAQSAGEFRLRVSSMNVPGQKLRLSDLELTKSLLLVTTAFVLLNLPSYLCRLFMSKSNPHDWETILFHFCYFLYYLHHTVLFFLYIFNSAQMRKQLKPAALKLLECYCLKAVPDFGH